VKNYHGTDDRTVTVVNGRGQNLSIEDSYPSRRTRDAVDRQANRLILIDG